MYVASANLFVSSWGFMIIFRFMYRYPGVESWWSRGGVADDGVYVDSLPSGFMDLALQR